MKKIYITLLSSFIASLLFSGKAFAQEFEAVRSGLSVSPPLSEVVIQPGKSITQAFNIKNEGQVDLEITPVVVDFSPQGQTGTPIILQDSPFPYAQLQNLDKALGKPFILPQGAEDQLVLRISIPEDAQPKDYYETLLLKAKPSGLVALDGPNSIAQPYVGIHILITVSESGQDLGFLETADFVFPRILDIFSTMNLELFAQNTGETFTKAQGEIKIQSMTGEVVKVMPILGENVLAKSMRKLHASIPDPEDPKSATATEFSYRPFLLFGPYTITVKLHAEHQEPVVKTYTALALPISPAIAALAIFGAMVVRKRVQQAEKTRKESR